LRLSDWKIDLEFTDDFNESTLKGRTCVSPKFLESEIELRDDMSEEETELTLVHELLHSRFPNHTNDESSIIGYEFEVGVEVIARALMEGYDNRG
jgi:hypothetical protein